MTTKKSKKPAPKKAPPKKPPRPKKPREDFLQTAHRVVKEATKEK